MGPDRFALQIPAALAVETHATLLPRRQYHANFHVSLFSLEGQMLTVNDYCRSV